MRPINQHENRLRIPLRRDFMPMYRTKDYYIIEHNLNVVLRLRLHSAKRVLEQVVLNRELKR